MKKNRGIKFIKGLAIIALAGMVITGCKKSTTTTDSDTNSSNENSFAQARFDEAGNISDQAAANSITSYRLSGNANNGSILSSCATIRFDTVNHPDSIIVNFGTTNCLCHDGRYRRGIIYITYTKPHYWDSLDVITLTFSNYYVNDYGISGTKTVTNMGRVGGYPTWNCTVVNGMITKPASQGGGSYTWNSNITRKQTAGMSTPWIWYTYVYQYTGNSNGVSSNGNGYTAVITNPLVYDLSCPWCFVQGTIDFTPTGHPMRIIDYGTGSCTGTVTVNISGTIYTVHVW